VSAKVDISEREMSGVVDAAREVALRRRAVLLRLRKARDEGNVRLVFEIIDELVPGSVLNSHDKTVPTAPSGEYGGPRRV